MQTLLAISDSGSYWMLLQQVVVTQVVTWWKLCYMGFKVANHCSQRSMEVNSCIEETEDS